MWKILIVGVLLSYPQPRVLGLSSMAETFSSQSECERVRASESFSKAKADLGAAIQEKFNAEFWASDRCVNAGVQVRDEE